MADLKPCPFCGDTVKIIHKCNGFSTDPSTIRDEFIAGCEKCGIYTPRFTTKIWLDKSGELHIEYNGADKAAEAWNRRVENG